MSSRPLNIILAHAACTRLPPCPTQKSQVFDVMMEFDIGQDNMSMIYMSSNPYFDSLGQPLDLCKYNLMKRPTGGLSIYKTNGRVYLTSMEKGSPAAKIPNWQTRICGAWLIKLDATLVSTIAEVKNVFTALWADSATSTNLLFAHLEIQPNLLHNGLPIVLSAPFLQSTHDQLNKRWYFLWWPTTFVGALDPIELWIHAMYSTWSIGL